MIDRYVEIDDPRAEYRGVAVHLAVCPACRAEHDGLLALIEWDDRSRHARLAPWAKRPQSAD